MASYTTTEFLNSVRQRGSIPTTTNTNNVNSTSNLLALATEELHIGLLPLIMSVRAEFYVATKTYAITQDLAEYAVPPRASGMILRDVQIVAGTEIKSLTEIQSEDARSTATGIPESYYFEHQNVVLYPTPSATVNTLKLKYYVRPGRLAATSDCAQITAINTGTNTVTVSTAPSTWIVTTSLDMVAQKTPHQFRAMESAVTAIAGSDFTFASLPTGLAIGDWLAPAEYSPIPQVPFEFQPVLAQMTTVKALEAIGDGEGLARALKDLDKIQKNALQLVTPRNHGEPKRVMPTRWR